MDPVNDLPDLIEDLEVHIDELADTLSPLLRQPLTQTATSLPLLDKSKLYVLTAYAIESLLFNTLLTTDDTDAKSHPLFTELGRLRGYFGKIKEIEERAPGGAWESRARLDTEAAGRFIKHGLSGNEAYDAERAQRMQKEKERAAEKARALVNKKFDEEEETPKKRGADNEDEGQDDDSEPAAKKARTVEAGESVALPKRSKRSGDKESGAEGKSKKGKSKGKSKKAK